MSESDEGSSARGDASPEASPAASPEHEVEQQLDEDPELTGNVAQVPFTHLTSNDGTVGDFASMEKEGGR